MRFASAFWRSDCINALKPEGEELAQCLQMKLLNFILNEDSLPG